MRDASGRHITGTLPEDDAEAYEAYRELYRSRGLGDTVEKAIKLVGADKIAKLYEKKTGRACRCSDRKELLNRLFPYKK